MTHPRRTLLLLVSLVLVLMGWRYNPKLLSQESEPAKEMTITLQSLLLEMVDRDSLARFPEPAYRQLQSSSYNRKSTSRDQADQTTQGWFADSDGVSWIRDEIRDGSREAVIMEHDGPGCLTRLWTPFFYYSFGNRVGPRIRIYLDGSETPVIDEHFIELLTRNDWPAAYGPKPPLKNRLNVPSPFAEFTARAGDLYLPVPFARSCKVTLTDKAFYNIVNYRAYPRSTRVEAFTKEEYEVQKSRLTEVGRELKDPTEFTGGTPYRIEGEVSPGEAGTVALGPGPAAVRHLEIRWDPDELREDPSLLRSTVLKMVADGEDCIWCPLGDFFGSTNALNPLQTHSRTVTHSGTMVCRWVMPYETSASISLQNLGKRPIRVRMAARVGNWRWDDRSMHFHGRWRSDHVQQGHQFLDWNFVDIRGQGVLVGDQWTVLNLTRGWWGEGDEKIYIDGSYDEKKFPDHFGTGTEDYYGWAGGVNPTREDVFFHPYLANISVGSTSEGNTRGFNICARLRGLDAIPFSRRLVFDMEASPGVGQRNRWNLLGYSAVTFWYARPGATSNRPPLPSAAAKPLMSLDELQGQSERLADPAIHRVPGAIEFEALKPSSRSPGVNVHAQIPSASHRPELLSGQSHMFIPFRKAGEYVEVRITERFKARPYELFVSKCYDYGVVKISVNGRVVKESLDLHSRNLEVQKVDLGVVRPVDNTIVIRIELVKPNPRSRGSRTFAGIDYLLPGPVDSREEKRKQRGREEKTTDFSDDADRGAEEREESALIRVHLRNLRSLRGRRA